MKEFMKKNGRIYVGKMNYEQQLKEDEKVIEVLKDDGFTFWKKKGEMCWSRDIVELSKLIKEEWRFK